MSGSLLLLLCAACAVNAALLVQTNSGLVQGFTFGNAPVNGWLGIPYANPPVGSLRLSPPQAVTPWSGVLSATDYGNSCVQPAGDNFAGGGAIQSENCLFLNIYAPSSANASSALPVMFWIHGGSLISGGGALVTYNGTALAAQQNVVVVTINYRLSYLGFLPLNVTASQSTNGAYGFLDQQMALQWAHANIAAFGGDPNQITLFGESAGGSSVSTHVATPSSWAYFKQAIVESSAGFFETRYITAAIAQANLEFLQNSTISAQCGNATDLLACLRTLPASYFIAYTSNLQTIAIPFGPGQVVDQSPLQAVSTGRYHPGALLGGNTADEGTIFVEAVSQAVAPCNNTVLYNFAVNIAMRALGIKPAYIPSILAQYPCAAYNASSSFYALSAIAGDALLKCPTFLFLEGKAATNTGPVYNYNFSHTPSWVPAILGAYHSSELPFVFNTVGIYNPTPAEQVLGNQMSSAWAAFAISTNPSIPSQPQWPLFPLKQLKIDTGAWTVEDSNLSDICFNFWQPIYEGSYLPEAFCAAPYASCSSTFPCCDPRYSCLRHTHAPCNAGNTTATEQFICAIRPR